MAHHGWIFPFVVQVGGYLGTFIVGILTGLYGHVFKYSLDQANELRELIVKIRREISNFENQEFVPLSLPSVRVTPAFSSYASDLKSKLELIPWYWYFLIRFVLFVQLPSKEKIRKASELLPHLAVQELGNPQIRQDALSIAKNIKDLLK